MRIRSNVSQPARAYPFRRKQTSNAHDTFDDIKQDLEEFHLKNKTSMKEKMVTRDKRHKILHKQGQGKPVGQYHPKFNLTEK